jgi:hypothetical protein
MSAGVVACVVLFLPLFLIAYVLHIGVMKHARYVPNEGNFFTRFLEVWRENEEKRRKRFWCIPYGFLLVVLEGFSAGNERGEWEEIEDEDGDGKDKDAPLPPFWKNPWDRFLKRFGPLFKDFTANSWYVSM